MSGYALGYPHLSQIAAHTAHSIYELLSGDWQGDRLLRGRVFAVAGPAGLVDEARNQVVVLFLESDAEWLVTIDSDTVFAPHDVRQLLACCDARERPVVGGVIYGAGPNGQLEAVAPVEFEGRSEPFEVPWIGTGFAAFHRRVFSTGARFGTHLLDGTRATDDRAICDQLSAAGVPIHLAPRVRVGHAKTVVLRARGVRA